MMKGVGPVRRIGPTHGNICAARDGVTAEEWAGNLKVGFVRHPWQWSVSMFFFQQRSPLPLEKVGIRIPSNIIDFDYFLEQLPITPMWWLENEVRGLSCDKIFRTEDMAEVAKLFGVDEVHVNRTSEFTDDTVGVTPSRLRLIERKFERELEWY